jgi:hypothetical protein
MNPMESASSGGGAGGLLDQWQNLTKFQLR